MGSPAAQQSEPRSRGLERGLIALIAVAAWSIAPPYVGPLVGLRLDVSSTVEIVDHVLPGLLTMAAAWLALALARSGRGDSTRALAAIATCALAGLFQTVSHVTLVVDAGGPLRPVGAVILHATPGPVLLALALALLLRPLPAAGR